jgi:lysophospholipase L1-like esterase
VGSQRTATLLLLLVSSALALLVAEITLRSLRSFATDDHSEFLVPHPTLGWMLQPNARYQAAIDGELFEIAYNGRGWRDIERTPAPSDDPRVVVLGDSFMEGYTVPLEQNFHRQLESRLRGSLPALEVINLGVSGYGTLQALLAYEMEGRRYAPDLVLLGFYLSNDLRDNSLEIETLRKPGSRKARDRPFLLPGSDGSSDGSSDGDWELTIVESEHARERYEAALARRRSWWWRIGDVSRIWRLTVAQWTDSALRALEEEPEPEGTLTRPERRALELGVFACEPHPAYERASQITRRILLRLDQQVRADGARLVVFTVPSEVEASPAPRGLHDLELPCREDPPAYAPLRDFLAQHDIPLIDLLPHFQRRMREPGAGIFASDAHWNATGHALAADRVAQELEARGLLPEAGSPAKPDGPHAARPGQRLLRQRRRLRPVEPPRARKRLAASRAEARVRWRGAAP